MAIQREEIESIVVEVLSTLSSNAVLASSTVEQGDWGVFENLDQAVRAATAAYRQSTTIALREKIVAVMRTAARDNAKRLAEMAVEETGMGRIEDKTKKNLLVADRTPTPWP